MPAAADTPVSDFLHAERLWSLDPAVTFLNHGSFGACPRAVLQAQQEWRDRMEREPVRFFLRDLPAQMDAVRTALGAFLRADPENLAFVRNATMGVNAVLRSLQFQPGDELLTTDHCYNACRNTLEFVAAPAGARVVVAPVPFPLRSPDQVVDAVMSAVTPRTRLALLDHVTSPTGMIFPVERLVPQLRARGVLSLIDGAHGPGMLDLDLNTLDPDFYTGNCHKWMCTPKGAALLYVRRALQAQIRPAVISHGANAVDTTRSRFRHEFDWLGTEDPTPILAIPAAIRFLGSLLPGGWPALRARNRALVLQARERLCRITGAPPPCPAEMIGALATIPLPDGDTQPRTSAWATDPLQDRLDRQFRIQVPIVGWPAPPRRWVRVSAQLYNRPEHYERLALAITELLAASPARS